jgi:anion-transporting  ArsA/GET3 family ATPase
VSARVDPVEPVPPAEPAGRAAPTEPVEPVEPDDVAPRTEASRAALVELVAERSIVVCCGSGGVGKTTTAAVVALEGARLGRKAVVVTIDPAKRLADALGLQGLTNTPSRIDGDWPGELWATMLDTRSTFDTLVRKHAATPDQGERILANRFYRNIAGALSGTQEYMAMEKLYELHEEADFDLVVVDTPPTRHALDFLDAPRRLSRFLDHRLFRLLIAPSRGFVRAVNVAAQTFVRTVSKVVGGDVVDDAVAFFQAFEGMEEGFRRRAARVNDLLAAPETAFVLVASPQRDTVEEAQFFADRLREAGIAVQGLVVNRVHPSFAVPSASGSGSRLSEAIAAGTAERAETLAGTPLGGQYRNLADFQAVASRERAHLAGLAEAVAPAPVVWVPFLRSDVHDLEGMDEVAGHVFSRAPRPA